ncbi:hypothetical protein K435DRAFT_868259 [Dendrothele bispora CBS 962.96]|uniref:Uncharacterized protein n=1 Tax=Dendrothele bispora (strain CBS 962.96) TaxID=1314807 RepID=A0A4S8LDL9_DENBC|nr:hypothetical protein K435DRAFT_868259 [Dendrothele bispora CBS 962.96]
MYPSSIFCNNGPLLAQTLLNSVTVHYITPRQQYFSHIPYLGTTDHSFSTFAAASAEADPQRTWIRAWNCTVPNSEGVKILVIIPTQPQDRLTLMLRLLEGIPPGTVQFQARIQVLWGSASAEAAANVEKE